MYHVVLEDLGCEFPGSVSTPDNLYKVDLNLPSSGCPDTGLRG